MGRVGRNLLEQAPAFASRRRGRGGRGRDARGRGRPRPEAGSRPLPRGGRRSPPSTDRRRGAPHRARAGAGPASAAESGGQERGQGGEAGPAFPGLGRGRVLAVETVEGRRGLGLLATGEVGATEIEEGRGRLTRAGRRHRSSAAGSLASGFGLRARSAAAAGRATQATVPWARLRPRDRNGRPLRPARGPPARGPRPMRRGRGGGSAGRPGGSGGAGRRLARPASRRRSPAARRARPEASVPGKRWETDASAVAAWGSSRRAASRSCRFGGVPRLRLQAPVGSSRRRAPRGGRGGRGSRSRREPGPYMGPRAFGSPPARIRTSSSEK